MSKAQRLLFPAMLFLTLILPGCGSAKPSESEELKTFGLLYYNTQQVLQKPPTDWEQLFMLVNVPDLKEDFDQLTKFKNAGYTIVWGVDASSPNAGATVLCYSNTSLEEGGPVLFADGSVSVLSAEDIATKVQASN